MIHALVEAAKNIKNVVGNKGSLFELTGRYFNSEADIYNKMQVCKTNKVEIEPLNKCIRIDYTRWSFNE